MRINAKGQRDDCSDTNRKHNTMGKCCRLQARGNEKQSPDRYGLSPQALLEVDLSEVSLYGGVGYQLRRTIKHNNPSKIILEQLIWHFK